jgi:hypothetical protein
MRLLLATLAALLTGCSTQPEVTVLAGPRKVDLGDTEVALTIQVLQQIGESRWRCGWTHQSLPGAGEPFFPDREEIVFDQLACGPRWGGGER